MNNHFRIPRWLLLGVIVGNLIAQNKETKLSEMERNLQMCIEKTQRGDFDKAITLGQQAVALSPDNARCHYALANAYALKARRAGILKKMGATKSYLTEIDRVISLDPRHFDARMDLIQFYLKAPGIIGGSVRKAGEQATQTARISPMHGCLAYGQIYAYEKNFNLAEKEFNKALAIQPQNIEALFALGIFHVQSKKYGNATEIFNRILQIDPKAVSALYCLGRIAWSTGKDMQKGLEYLQKYLETEPKENQPTQADTYRRMGNILEKMGMRDRAMAAYEKALQWDSGHEEAKDDLEKCKKKSNR